MKTKRRRFPARYLLMDGRAFEDIDAAAVFDTADTIKEAKQRARPFGSLNEFEVAIVDNKTDEVVWELYAEKRKHKPK